MESRRDRAVVYLVLRFVYLTFVPGQSAPFREHSCGSGCGSFYSDRLELRSFDGFTGYVSLGHYDTNQIRLFLRYSNSLQ